ncbi:MAG: hypothetical protein A3I66_13780 [Burkholderiales bacterium RIFCSPLOWO2_02_FULL_57_36]|nr:MAG: hypothetical protein A3I66_13780 [Burkholderiales bacterium RIFCSPLOWO2_02_FULL_57_36]
MRRFLIILLLFALPLQVSWAAVATYCKHESGVAAQHFGHHEHAHQAKQAEPVKDPSTLTVDNDCVACHLASAGLLPTAFLSTLSEPLQAEQLGRHIPLISYLLPDRPERPKWMRAA